MNSWNSYTHSGAACVQQSSKCLCINYFSGHLALIVRFCEFGFDRTEQKKKNKKNNNEPQRSLCVDLLVMLQYTVQNMCTKWISLSLSLCRSGYGRFPIRLSLSISSLACHSPPLYALRSDGKNAVSCNVGWLLPTIIIHCQVGLLNGQAINMLQGVWKIKQRYNHFGFVTDFGLKKAFPVFNTIQLEIDKSRGYLLKLFWYIAHLVLSNYSRFMYHPIWICIWTH